MNGGGATAKGWRGAAAARVVGEGAAVEAAPLMLKSVTVAAGGGGERVGGGGVGEGLNGVRAAAVEGWKGAAEAVEGWRVAAVAGRWQ